MEALFLFGGYGFWAGVLAVILLGAASYDIFKHPTQSQETASQTRFSMIGLTLMTLLWWLMMNWLASGDTTESDLFMRSLVLLFAPVVIPALIAKAVYWLLMFNRLGWLLQLIRRLPWIH